MRTSIATVSPSGDLVEKLEAIAAAGFNGVEIFERRPYPGFGAPNAQIGLAVQTRMLRGKNLSMRGDWPSSREGEHA